MGRCSDGATKVELSTPRTQVATSSCEAIHLFLYDLAAGFEAAYLIQLRRHHQTRARCRGVNPQQPWLDRDDGDPL
jgi:hypothetical protein